jgi:plastocyanin
MRTFAALLVMVFLAACGADEPTSSDTVEMRLIAYRPSALEISAGDAVTWRQHDAGFHTVTSGTVGKDGSGTVRPRADGTFASGRLATGKTFRFTFDDAGSYAYFCEIHPATMSGQVTVT